MGEQNGGFALTVPSVSSDVAGLRSTAKLDDDEHVINGEKMWISMATKAHTALWIARTNPDSEKPHQGIAAFILEMDRPGVSVGDIHDKHGVRAGSAGWINCQDVRVPIGNRLGERARVL